MRDMKRLHLTILAAAAVGALAPATAAASVVELGATKSPLVAPTCPSGVSASACTIILTQVTALETLGDSVAYPTTVSHTGYVVAFTVGLSRLSSNITTARNDVHFLNAAYGGTSRVAITVVKPVGPSRQRRWQLVSESPLYHVQPYLGRVVQFPLTKPLLVKPRERIALTVPTWAPVLSFDLPSKQFAYRQSRSTGCKTVASSSNAQTRVGSKTSYACNYPGTRVEYSATEITSPVPPASQIHTVRILR